MSSSILVKGLIISLLIFKLFISSSLNKVSSFVISLFSFLYLDSICLYFSLIFDLDIFIPVLYSLFILLVFIIKLLLGGFFIMFPSGILCFAPVNFPGVFDFILCLDIIYNFLSSIFWRLYWVFLSFPKFLILSL